MDDYKPTPEELKKAMMERFILVPTLDIDYPKGVREYWQTIYDSGLLKLRMADRENPTLENVERMLKERSTLKFTTYDLKEKRFCADCLLNNIRGLSAFAHFSVHPAYKGMLGVNIARAGAEQIFTLTDTKTNRTIDTLIGSTPVTNKLAIKFIKKVGYKEKCILTNTYFLASTGTITDSLITQLRKGEVLWE